MSQKRIFLHGMILLGVLLLATTATNSLPQSLYDDFKGGTISLNKWVGGEGASELGREVTRAIENQKLRLKDRSVGFTALDNGTGSDFVYLGLPDPESAGGLKATVTATTVNDVGCDGNPTPTRSFA